MNNIKIDLVKKSYEELQELVIQFMTDKFILKTQLEAYENMRKEALDKLNNWDEEKSLAIDNYYLKDDLLNILNKVGDSDESEVIK